MANRSRARRWRRLHSPANQAHAPPPQPRGECRLPDEVGGNAGQKARSRMNLALVGCWARHPAGIGCVAESLCEQIKAFAPRRHHGTRGVGVGDHIGCRTVMMSTKIKPPLAVVPVKMWRLLLSVAPKRWLRAPATISTCDANSRRPAAPGGRPFCVCKFRFERGPATISTCEPGKF